MTTTLRFARRAAWAVIAAATLLAVPVGAAPTSPSPIKRLQARRLVEEPMRERREFKRERLRELRRLARTMKQDGRTSLRVRGESARPRSENGDMRAGRPLRPGIATPLAAGEVGAAPRANRRCNDPAGDGLLDGQCETAIVRWNDYLMAAWNDGTGYTDRTLQMQGWATSTDGGVTWVDRGKFPVAPGPWRWASDPVLAVNPTTGAFYYAGLASANAPFDAIGVLKGRFSGTTFAWEPVSVALTVPITTLDKEWLAIDPATGRAYLSYTEFAGSFDHIGFVSADSSLAAWTAPQQLSPLAEDGWVQGSRPVVGPNGTVYVVYYLIGAVDVDYFRTCRSTDHGASFSTPETAVGFYSNFFGGAPGFDRPQGINFPSIAVDRSGGAHNGRLYLAWSESLNWYDDTGLLGNLGVRAESEPNNTAPTATPFAIGQTASGSVNAGSDIFDWYALTLGAGQSLIVSASSVSGGLTISMRVFATDGNTELAYTTASDTDLLLGYHPALVYTAPTAGQYYIRIASHSGSGSYAVGTCAATRGSERGRDQRDAFVGFSDDGGTTWSTPVRVSNSPVGFDDWLPEVAVGTDGQVYAAWYDWRDAAASTNGGESNVYLARSGDGGATWAELGATSDARTAWSVVNSNITPNQGDYISLFADAGGLSVAWSDGRGGTSDVYMSYWTKSEASTLPALVSATAVPGRVDLRWRVGAPAGFAAVLYRRLSGAPAWNSLGTLLSATDGSLVFADTTVQQGSSYDYRLGVTQAGTEHFYGEATVRTPQLFHALVLAGAWPNPATGTPVISFTLASASAATLDLLDLGGRRIFTRDVTATSGEVQKIPVDTGGRLRPGVYFVRLTQAGVTRSKRIVVL